MAAADTAGTILVEPKWQAGMTYEVVGELSIPEAVETGDTWTFTNILPENKVTIVGGSYNGVEFDTNASPTATVIIGDGTDTDGYLESRVGGGAESRQTFGFDGALLDATPASRSVVVTLGGTVATAASSGTATVSIRYYCSDGAGY